MAHIRLVDGKWGHMRSVQAFYQATHPSTAFGFRVSVGFKEPYPAAQNPAIKGYIRS